MKDDWTLNRAEIRHHTPRLNFSAIKPYHRREAVADLQQVDSTGKNLSEVDRYNLHSFLMANSEWSKPGPSFISRKPVLKHFYQNKANALELRREGWVMIFNPMIQYQQYKEKNNDENVFLNSRGLQVRALIQDKVGFSFYLSENQERPPAYVNRWVNKYQAVPGVGMYKSFKNSSTAYDYFETRASVSWKVSRFMDMQLGYDKNFIGNGYRSLLLSDFSNDYTFLKINTRFGKFRYQNLFTEMFPFHEVSFDRVLPRKYYRAHYLSYAPNEWLNLGLFEGTMIGRAEKLNLRLFNPVIFLQLPAKKNHLPDRSYLGFDVKANLFNTVQLYGQLVIDKLKLSGLDEKTWDNRFGWQAGLKYIDVFGLNNVDLQLETNRVRPYTYAAADSITSYTHYNQPLAHPLGANFEEYIAILKAQPLKQVYLQAKVIAYVQGLDFLGYNMGSNPFGGWNKRLSDVRVRIGDGDRATAVLASFLASYELRQNLFIDASFTKRNYETTLTGKDNTSFFSLGLRWNMARREFDF